TRVPKKRRAGAPPDSVLRPCPSCGIEHQRFARCADRVLRTNSRISAKAAAELEREPAMTDAQVADVIATPAPDVAGTPAEDPAALRDQLRGIVSSEAREEALHETVGDTGMTVAEIKEHALITDP